MSKRNIIVAIVFLIFGLIVTFVLGIIDFITNKTSIHAGLPFKFTSAALFFGTSEIDYFMLTLDIIIWAAVLLVIWKFIFKK